MSPRLHSTALALVLALSSTGVARATGPAATETVPRSDGETTASREFQSAPQRTRTGAHTFIEQISTRGSTTISWLNGDRANIASTSGSNCMTVFTTLSGRHFRIDWSKVSRAEGTSDGQVSVVAGNFPVPLYLFFESGQVASRVEAAFEFLRIDCDPSTSTGF